MPDLVEKLLAGNPRAIARILTQIQNEDAHAHTTLDALYPHTGNAHRIGITGSPGTGKSSLVSALARAYRKDANTVAIIAVDPTSPFSGGAVLGDRIRMRDLAGDPGVFIRSMATRGSLGGLARATGDAARVLDAAGFDIILIETVGAGQSEVDIASEAHTTLVVEAPGLGDDIQAIKAGILEIADILVVNKADRPDTAQTVRALQAMLDLGRKMDDDEQWQVCIQETVAIKDEGIVNLRAAITQHWQYLQANKRLQLWERQHLERELTNRLKESLLKRALEDIGSDPMAQLLDKVSTRKIAPYAAVEQLLSLSHPTHSNPSSPQSNQERTTS